MKISKYLILFLGIMVLLTGCYKFSTPDELIQKPKDDTEKEAIKKSIEKYLPTRAKLTIPLSSKDAGAINEVDLDGDNQKEIVAFYEEQERNFEIGFMVLKENKGKWEKVDLIKGEGYYIEYAGFYDLNKDGKKEIIIGWDHGEYTRTNCIYTMKEDKIIQTFNGKYMDMKIDDVNEDGKLDIFLLNADSKTFKISLNLYTYTNDKMEFMDRVDMETNYEMGYSSMKIGKATKTKKGVFIDVPFEAHSGYTELLTVKNNKLKKVFEEGGIAKTYQIYPVGSEDIDEDEIIEIGILNEPIGYEKEALVNIPWIITWYNWDGKKGLSFNRENYYNYNEGYRFDIPKTWKGKFTLKEGESESGTDLIFYYSKNYPNQKIEILKISSFSIRNWTEKENLLKEKNTDYVVLGKNENKVFVGFLNEKKINKSMTLEREVLQKSFRLIY